MTPYRSREQISSGALTFAIAAGCGSSRRRTGTRRTCSRRAPARSCRSATRPRSPTPSATTSSSRESLAAARAEARRIGEQLAWPSVAEATAAVLREARRAGAAPAAVGRRRPAAHELRTDHLLTLVDDVGIIQHANGVIPNRDSGYCVDDVARLAVVALELARRGDEQVWTSILYRSLAFLHARRPATAGCGTSWATTGAGSTSRTSATTSAARSGRWARSSPPRGSPPSSGRPRRLLDTIVADAPGEALAADRRLRGARPRPPRPDRLDPAARRVLERVVEQLAAAYASTRAEGWRWFEDELTYDNARLPHALIVGGVALGQDALSRRASSRCAGSATSPGWRTACCGCRATTAADRAEPAPGAGDEQPLDASAFVEAELAAFAVTGEPEHGVRAQKSFDWFLGRNQLQRPLYDFATGGCSDGLGDETTNDNEGAESTLAFHRAALLLDTAGLPAVDRHGSARIGDPHERARAVHPPSGEPDPDRRRLAVSRQRRLQPGGGAARRRRPSCSPASRIFAVSRTSLSRAPERRDGWSSTRSRSSRRGGSRERALGIRGSRASSTSRSSTAG